MSSPKLLLAKARSAQLQLLLVWSRSFCSCLLWRHPQMFVCMSDCCASETWVRGGLWQSMVPARLDDDAPNQSYYFSENHPSVPRHWSAMGVCTIIPTKPANSECPFCELWWVWGWLSLSLDMVWSPIFVPTLSLFTTQLLWQTEWWKDILNARSEPVSKAKLMIPALLVQLFSLKSYQARTLGNKWILGFGMSKLRPH